ncbi:formate/nitrite transporter family protein [Marinobacter mobilis]|uniref:Formate/nitrite transporter n=1 Tax=Marinobacter mobilis TaxID=488533 RepID=A0A1H2T3V9_9GAMM|nr:formate/nitrite transporter family protein [Marinobacter mobilis]SDW38395.1 formate/nitrite transporter [Marinobacter mobilis]
MDTNQQVSDAYPPTEIARKVEKIGVTKARLDTLSVLVLSVLAGAFISLGALFYAVVVTDTSLGFGVTRLLGGVSFSLGLILVVVAGAELFTGNNLIAMAWASGLIRTRDVLRSWLLTYIGNAVGCVGTVVLVAWSGIDTLANDAVGRTVVDIARSKSGLSMSEAFARGILCNVLVCLAVWLAIGARSVTDKIMAILFPVTAFVVMGFEHSVANWFFLPYGFFLDSQGLVSLSGALQNLLLVSAGNIVGGTLLVSGVYWIAYLRRERI